MWESCAIMQYLCNKHHLDHFYPSAPAARAMVDSAMFYHHRHALPLSRARHLSRAGLPAISGRGRRKRRRRRSAKAAAQKAAVDALAEPLDVFHKFYMSGKPFIGGVEPSIADIRLASTLEFLAVIDYPLPGLGEDLHGRDGEDARRRLFRAGRRRARLHRLREIAEEVTAFAPAARSFAPPAAKPLEERGVEG